MSGPRPETALAVNDFLATSGLFGVAVLGVEGTVSERYGTLVEHVGVGEAGEEAFPFLLGFEEELDAIRASGEGHLHLPNMNLTLEDGRLVFASVFVTRGPEAGTTTVVLQDTTEASNTHRQMMQQRNELDIARRKLEHANEQLRLRGEELDEARQRAEEATQAKSRFLAMMTHEIRTPMNGVLGMLQLMDDGSLDAERAGYARTARTSAEALLQIIGDILDFSKIEAGRLDIERIPMSVAEVMEGVTLLLRPRAEEKGIFLEQSLADGIPEAVLGDPVRCRQILLNLVGNAIKFTAEGGVVLTVEPLEGDPGTYRFTVVDTGIGIPEEAQGRLFQEFTQTDASTTRRYGGTGLGLAISRRLVELMDGSIGLQSAEGEGSAFWFTLPLEATEAPVLDEAGTIPDPVTGARILLADDALANRQVGLAMLGKAGYQVETAVDGRDAVEKVDAGGYDLVLMDLNMPELDGHQATAELRARGLTLPILAMTAHPQSELGDLVGFDGYVGKPVSRAALLTAVADALGRAGVVAHSPSAGPHSPAVQTPPPGVAASAPDARTSGTEGTEAVPERPAHPGDMNDGVLNRSVLLQFREDMGHDVFPALVETYLSETRKRVYGLAEQVEARDFAVVERYAHDIKTCAATLGADLLRDAAKELEYAARDGLGERVVSLVATVVTRSDQALALIESEAAGLSP